MQETTENKPPIEWAGDLPITLGEEMPKELMEDLGITDYDVDPHPILTEILKNRSWRARKVADFLLERYDWLVSLWLTSGRMEEIIASREEEAKNLFRNAFAEMSEKEGTKDMDFAERIVREEQIRLTVEELVDREVIRRPVQIF